VAARCGIPAERRRAAAFCHRLRQPHRPCDLFAHRVPTGGRELLILNSEVRIPLPIKKGLGVAVFYDGGRNVFQHVGSAICIELHEFDWRRTAI